LTPPGSSAISASRRHDRSAQFCPLVDKATFLGVPYTYLCHSMREVVAMSVPLTVQILKDEARTFAAILNLMAIPDLFGTTDGKAIGTYIEQKFRRHLEDKYLFVSGNSASGIDFPEVNVDVKATSIHQPQSSSPFKSASQKVYGLGHHLLIFVYEKTDDATTGSARLHILHVVFVDKRYTADWQMTTGIAAILDRQGNRDDLIAFFEERNLPLDEVGRITLAEQVLQERPSIGYLTVSNALQWCLQYG
jgi:hypothetical protein